jgi:hypothetical protein
MGRMYVCVCVCGREWMVDKKMVVEAQYLPLSVEGVPRTT